MNNSDFALNILSMPLDELRERRRFFDDLVVTQHRAGANGGDPSSPVQPDVSPLVNAPTRAGDDDDLTAADLRYERKMMRGLLSLSYERVVEIQRFVKEKPKGETGIGVLSIELALSIEPITYSRGIRRVLKGLENAGWLIREEGQHMYVGDRTCYAYMRVDPPTLLS